MTRKKIPTDEERKARWNKYHKGYCERNKDRLREYRKNYYRKYRKTHTENIKRDSKKYYESHKDVISEQWVKNKERNKLYSKEYNKKIHDNVITSLGGKCVHCGFSDERALQIDHINGGGRKETKGIGRLRIYKKILNNLEKEKHNYQVLCANCNWIKRIENDESGKR